MSSLFRRKDIMITIVAFCFGLVLVPYFLDIKELNTYANNLSKIVAVVTTSAFVISLYAQSRRNLIMVRQRSKGWPYQGFQLIIVFLIVAVGLILGQASLPYKWPIEAIQMSGSTVLYSIATFYMISAGARAFRARNTKVLLFLLSAVLVMLAQAPMTELYMSWPATIRAFLGDTFGKTATRIFAIGLGISGIVLGVRTLLGKEPATLGLQG